MLERKVDKFYDKFKNTYFRIYFKYLCYSAINLLTRQAGVLCCFKIECYLTTAQVPLDTLSSPTPKPPTIHPPIWLHYDWICPCFSTKKGGPDCVSALCRFGWLIALISGDGRKTHINDRENINCVTCGDPTKAKTVRLSSLGSHAHQASARVAHSPMKLGHNDRHNLPSEMRHACW